MFKRQWSFAILFLALLGGCAGPGRSENGPRLMNKPAPDFELTALDGAKVRLSSYRGRPVILAFFACGCIPCRAEAPHLSQLAEVHEKDGLVVLAVNAWDEDKGVVAEFANENRLKQRFLLDGSTVSNGLYGVYEVPMIFWLDRDGIVVDSQLDSHGPRPLEAKTRRLLSGKG